MLSEEALHALSLATKAQPGALSPLLKKFEWPSVLTVKRSLGESFSRSLSPHMSLFLGDSITDIHIHSDSMSPPPLHLAAIRAAIERLRPRLKSIAILEKFDVDWTHMPTSLAEQHLIPYAWDSLKSLAISIASTKLLRRLAILPRLASLAVGAVQRDLEERPPIPDAFPALISLTGVSIMLSDMEYILRLLPSANELQSLEWMTYLSTTPADRQDSLKVIRRHCNPSTLSTVKLIEKIVWDGASEEPIDVDVSQTIDLSPLYPFHQLQSLGLSLESPVRITSEGVTKLTGAWPRLEHLDLCSKFVTSCIPRIDHTHIVALASNLPLLQSLGVRFDATGVAGSETTANPSTSQLRNLWVGASPICSPSRVAAFINSHFPHLQDLSISYNDRPSRPAEQSMLDTRWQAAYNAWVALASQSRCVVEVLSNCELSIDCSFKAHHTRNILAPVAQP